MIDQLIEHCSELEDPRCPGKVEPRLIEILVIAVCAVSAGAERWEDLALYGRSKLGGLRQFLTLPHGMPSHDTFRRVLMRIDPDAFETRLTAWVGALATPGEHEVVALDGKTRRRAFGRGRDWAALPVVSAWASDQRLGLGQRRVDGKAKESTALPEVLDVVALENPLVTLDALGGQKDMAQRMLDRQADSLLVLKAHHSHAHEAVQSHCASPGFPRGAPHRPGFEAVDEGPGRLGRRRVVASLEAATLAALSDWPGLHTVLAIESIQSLHGSGKGKAESRYVLSSYPGEPQVRAQASRRHGSLENRRHGVLEVTCRADDRRLREATAARHVALLRQRALNRVGQDRSTQASLRAQRKKAAWDDSDRQHLLKVNFMREP